MCIMWSYLTSTIVNIKMDGLSTPIESNVQEVYYLPAPYGMWGSRKTSWDGPANNNNKNQRRQTEGEPNF